MTNVRIDGEIDEQQQFVQMQNQTIVLTRSKSMLKIHQSTNLTLKKERKTSADSTLNLKYSTWKDHILWNTSFLIKNNPNRIGMFVNVCYSTKPTHAKTQRELIFMSFYSLLAFELCFRIEEYKIRSAIIILSCERILFHVAGMLPAIFIRRFNGKIHHL